jgi:glutamine amidotransferase
MAVAIVDSGGANIASLQWALRRLGCEAAATRSPEMIQAASHVLLPGVGAAADSMARLREAGLDRLIPDLEQPVLGICLGMQLLFRRSEEGAADCLGVIPETIQQLLPAADRPVPHMGWNQVRVTRDVPLFEGVSDATHFYFVHGYYAATNRSTIATVSYGSTFAAAVACRNFHGVQFHPERSAAVGARVLRNFLALS